MSSTFLRPFESRNLTVIDSRGWHFGAHNSCGSEFDLVIDEVATNKEVGDLDFVC